MERKGTNRFFIPAVLTAAAMAAAGLSGCGAQGGQTLQIQGEESQDQIVVTGQDKVTAVPDMAEMVFAVRTQASTAQECQQKNGEDLNAAIEVLKGLGIEESSMQTSSYGMDPIYDWNSSTQEITGYEMRTSLTVSDVPIGQAGEVISQAVAAGVNSLDSVSYFCSSYDENYQEALTRAVEMARTKAQALAEAGGRTLGNVVNIEEYGYNPSQRYASGGSRNLAVAETAAAGSSAADMGVMPGEVDVEAQVTVTFSME
ncbi:MAG TPA: SIMPL domain-containing protein [Candidatus Enterocloster faecavium]|uniref:SIMPL domain-containing protein n=1 Tax=Candidatus Enterocloster faecavium TaxID=2838560 RepID=A0A9D2L7H1_9FIRM|nr:SIMPL domain-containing protein [Candidatus Enterocloster faecavium]